MKEKIPVLYQDNDFIAYNKPAGLLSVPDRYNNALPNLYQWAEKKFRKIWIVHRLDKDTSGVMIFALNEDAHKYLSQQFENRKVQKFYFALVYGTLDEKQGVIEAPVAEHPVQKGKMMVQKKGKSAITHYKVLEEFPNYSWLRLQIHTGRTHQIRVHLQSIAHTVVADEVYGKGQPFYLSSIKKKYKLGKFSEEEKPLLTRQALHAAQLIFTSSAENIINIEAPLPKDLEATLRQLKKNVRENY